MSAAKKQHVSAPAPKQETTALAEHIFPPTFINRTRPNPVWATLLLLGLQPQHFFSYRVQLPNVAAPSTYLGFYGALHLILFRAWLAYLQRYSGVNVSDWHLGWVRMGCPSVNGTAQCPELEASADVSDQHLPSFTRLPPSVLDWDSVLNWPLFKHLGNGLVISALRRDSASKTLQEEKAALPEITRDYAKQLLEVSVDAVSIGFLKDDRVEMLISEDTSNAALRVFLLKEAAPLQALLNADRDVFDCFSSLAVLHPKARHFQQQHIETEAPRKPLVFGFEEALAARVTRWTGGQSFPSASSASHSDSSEDDSLAPASRSRSSTRRERFASDSSEDAPLAPARRSRISTRRAQSASDSSEDVPLATAHAAHARRPRISTRRGQSASDSSEDVPLASAHAAARADASLPGAQAGSAAASASGSSSAAPASTTAAAVAGSSTAAATVGSSTSSTGQTPGTQLRRQIARDLYFSTGQAPRQPSGHFFF
jgi:hypothetical protein